MASTRPRPKAAATGTGAKRRKQPKAKPAPSNSAAKRPASPPPPAQEPDAPALDGDEVTAPAAMAKNRRLERRDTESQVERVVQGRLGKQFTIEAINGVVNDKGEHVREYIARHIRENRSSAKYLSSRFWTTFFSEFDLQVKVLGDLPEPPDPDEAVDDRWLKALKIAHNDNPSKRTVEPIERLLETMQKPNYTELYGLILSSQEAPTMCRASSVRMRVAILGCIARCPPAGPSRVQGHFVAYPMALCPNRDPLRELMLQLANMYLSVGTPWLALVCFRRLLPPGKRR